MAGVYWGFYGISKSLSLSGGIEIKLFTSTVAKIIWGKKKEKEHIKLNENILALMCLPQSALLVRSLAQIKDIK